MSSNSVPLRRSVTIVNDLGLHARAAAKLAQAAQNATGRVWLRVGSEQIDAKQIIDILTLAAAKGDRIEIIVEADADINTLNLIVALFDDGFGE